MFIRYTSNENVRSQSIVYRRHILKFICFEEFFMDEKKIRFADSGIPDDASESIGISEEKESTVPEAKIPANSYDSEGITAEQRPDRKPRRRRADPGTGGVSQPASSADDDDEIRITKIDNSDANRPAAGVPERPEKPASEAGAPEPDHRVVAGRSKKYAELNRKGQEPLKNEIEDRDPVRNENVNNPDFPVSDTGQNVEKTSEKADSEPAAPVPIPVPAGTASESEIGRASCRERV